MDSHSAQRFNMKLIYSTIFSVCLLTLSLFCRADRYYTWVDENGEVRHTLIADPVSQEPLKTPAEKSGDQSKVDAPANEPAYDDPSESKTENKPENTSVNTSVNTSENKTETDEANKSEALSADEALREDSQSASHNEVNAESENPLDTADTDTNPDEIANQISQARAQESAASQPDESIPAKASSAVPSEYTDQTKVQGTATVISSKVEGHDKAVDKAVDKAYQSSAVIEFEGEEYIDAAELERRGFVKPKEQRFYTVIDSDGHYRNIPYPDNAEIDSEATVELIEPQNYRIVAKEQPMADVIGLDNADPQALALLGIRPEDQSEIAILARHCCEDLKTYEHVELDQGDGNLLEVNEKDYAHEFGIGHSLLRIVKLPATDEVQTLRIRTYAGPKVFYPSILVLDEEYQPQRFLQDIVYVYEPENWFRYGYLEGYFKVDSQKSKYLVIFTTKKDERKLTVVEGIEEKPIVLHHDNQGILHLSQIGSPDKP